MQSSHPFRIDKTLASCNIVIDSLKRLCYWIDIAVQLIFIVLYFYSIYTNLENTALLVINSVLLAVSISYFIVHIILSSNKNSRKIKKAVRQWTKYLKMSVRFFAIGLAVYELMGASYTDIKLITTLFAGVGFLIQCLFEIIKFLTERYVNIIIEGVKMDVDEFMSSPLILGATKLVDTVKNPKTVLLETFNKSFSGQEETSVKEPTKLQNTIVEKSKELQDKRQTQKTERQQIKEQEKIIRAEKAFNDFKSNVKKFFGKNDDSDHTAE